MARCIVTVNSTAMDYTERHKNEPEYVFAFSQKHIMSHKNFSLETLLVELMVISINSSYVTFDRPSL